MGTRVLGLGLESDLSPDLDGLGLGLESYTSGLGLGLDSRHADSDLTWTRTSGLGPDLANCTAKDSFYVYLYNH